MVRETRVVTPRTENKPGHPKAMRPSPGHSPVSHSPGLRVPAPEHPTPRPPGSKAPDPTAPDPTAPRPRRQPTGNLAQEKNIRPHRAAHSAHEAPALLPPRAGKGQGAGSARSKAALSPLRWTAAGEKSTRKTRSPLITAAPNVAAPPNAKG